jgi:hypothetical protein
MIIYIQNISLNRIIVGLFKSRIWIVFFKKRIKQIYFIESSLISNFILIPMLSIFVKNINRLDFRMMDIKDSDGELVRTRIARVDLLVFLKEIINSSAYKNLRNLSWKQDSILDYMNKGVIDCGIMEDSPSRKIYILNVISWHMRKIKVNQSIVFINQCPWFELYIEYAKKYGIKLIDVPNNIFSADLRGMVRRFPKIYKTIKNIGHIKPKKAIYNDKNKVFLDGRGDIELTNNGMHSDFFWLLNSEFPLQNVMVDYHSNLEKKYLDKHDIFSVDNGFVFYEKDCCQYKAPRVEYSSRHKNERKELTSLLSSYNLDRQQWCSKFRQNNVKVFFTWFKYNNKHIALSDAIADNGGITAVWQMAFDGFENAQCMIKSDIAFSFSDFSAGIDSKVNSKIKYNIITGYVKDYAPPLLIKKANKLRKELESNGAKKIIFVIDENSGFDERWHTGHELQRENYSYLLKKVIEVPWLGVIFKPKNIKTLMDRLGPEIERLLYHAESTGRCYIYRDIGRHTTAAPPILAALSSDICIHGHLDAGTAALECALGGVPTLLIDREGAPYSKLHELPEGSVVFKDWPSTIDATMQHFNTPGGVEGFGDWSSIIDDLDPFRDGKAAYRIGSYLHSLIQGFDQGLEKEVIMKNAAEKYRKQWGDDKVIKHSL